MKRNLRGVFLGIILSLCLILPVNSVWAQQGGCAADIELTAPHVMYYDGINDGGLAHITYWTLASGDGVYDLLDLEEQAKVGKIQKNLLHSTLFTPDQLIAGYEVTGTLTRGSRVQTITLRLPDNWNGKLIVAGTPGLRNEYASEGVLVPWLLDAGYAYVAGDKGLVNGMADMLTGSHPTSYWGMMMLDLADWAQTLLEAVLGQSVSRTYAVGLSNGGYQVRRALELDHEAVQTGAKRLFDGGIDWSGAYWPDARVMDTDGDDKVSVAEYAAADTLVNTIDKAALAMKWGYDADGLATPAEFSKSPRFPDAQAAVTGAGFSADSSVYWGYYNTNYDAYKALLPSYKGVGYYNLVSYVYRAELLGDDETAAAAYTCFVDETNPDTAPPIYDWLETAANGGWTAQSVEKALINANTGEFSAPLISLHGELDGLVAVDTMAKAYETAVATYGDSDKYRLYIIKNAGHVDVHADAVTQDFDFDGTPGNEPGIADLLTPMQPFVQRAFDYLTDWVENAASPPDSTTVDNDPANDVTDSAQLSW